MKTSLRAPIRTNPYLVILHYAAQKRLCCISHSAFKLRPPRRNSELIENLRKRKPQIFLSYYFGERDIVYHKIRDNFSLQRNFFSKAFHQSDAMNNSNFELTPVVYASIKIVPQLPKDRIRFRKLIKPKLTICHTVGECLSYRLRHISNINTRHVSHLDKMGKEAKEVFFSFSKLLGICCLATKAPPLFVVVFQHAIEHFAENENFGTCASRKIYHRQSQILGTRSQVSRKDQRSLSIIIDTILPHLLIHLSDGQNRCDQCYASRENCPPVTSNVGPCVVRWQSRSDVQDQNRQRVKRQCRAKSIEDRLVFHSETLTHKPPRLQEVLS